MVNPDIVGLLNADGISRLSQDLGNHQITDDNVVLLVDTKTNTLES